MARRMVLACTPPNLQASDMESQIGQVISWFVDICSAILDFSPHLCGLNFMSKMTLVHIYVD